MDRRARTTARAIRDPVQVPRSLRRESDVGPAPRPDHRARVRVQRDRPWATVMLLRLQGPKGRRVGRRSRLAKARVPVRPMSREGRQPMRRLAGWSAGRPARARKPAERRGRAAEPQERRGRVAELQERPARVAEPPPEQRARVEEGPRWRARVSVALPGSGLLVWFRSTAFVSRSSPRRCHRCRISSRELGRRAGSQPSESLRRPSRFSPTLRQTARPGC